MVNLTETIGVSENYVSRNNYETFVDGLMKNHDSYMFAKEWLHVASKEHPTLVKNIDRFMNRKRPPKNKK